MSGTTLRSVLARRTSFLALVALLLTWAATDLATAGWIQAKGWLGQALMERHWSAGADQREALPWPGARTRPVARLRLPELQIDRLVVEGTATPGLAWGPGLAQGRRGHRVIAAHRDTHFAFLGRVRPGQSVELEEASGQISRWTVDELRVVDSRTTTLDLDAAGPRLTLVTCWPLNAVETGGPLRLLVRARPTGGPDAAGASG
jgi:sortase A